MFPVLKKINCLEPLLTVYTYVSYVCEGKTTNTIPESNCYRRTISIIFPYYEKLVIHVHT